MRYFFMATISPSRMGIRLEIHSSCMSRLVTWRTPCVAGLWSWEQFLHNGLDGSGIAVLFDVVEDDVKRPFRPLERGDCLAHMVVDQAVKAQGGKMAACLLGKRFIPNGMMHYAAAVFLDGACKPGCGVAVAVAKLKDASRAGEPGQLITEMACHGADDREIVLGRIAFHPLHLGGPRRDEFLKITRNLWRNHFWRRPLVPLWL